MRRLAALSFLLALLPLPAGAAGCPAPGVTVEELVATGLRSEPYSYDAAVVGRVVEVVAEGAGSGSPGRTYVSMSVIGVYGVRTPWSGLVLTTPDPGTDGYAFEPGAAYFVPFDLAGPDGEVNYVAGCDLVERVQDPEATAARLATVAGESQVDFVYPVTGDVASGAVVTVVFLGAAAALLWWTLRVRRQAREQFSATGSDPHRPPEPRP